MALYATFLAFKAALTGWVVNDAWSRERRWIPWGLATGMFGLLALPFWLFSRRRSPARRALPIRQVLAIYAATLAFIVMSSATFQVVTTYGYQVARVEGNTMSPTIANDDRLIVDKWHYLSAAPKPGDIVMMHFPLNPEKLFVKRVVAREGDQVRIVDGQVLVNDVPAVEPYVEESRRSRESWGPEIVPEGHYFVMGDNRRNSSDSRHWGWVPAKYITGRVRLRWFPLSSATTF